jgi:hypothetical protein
VQTTATDCCRKIKKGMKLTKKEREKDRKSEKEN